MDLPVVWVVPVLVAKLALEELPAESEVDTVNHFIFACCLFHDFVTENLFAEI